MSETENGHVLVLEGKCLQVLDDLCDLGEDEVKGTLNEDQIGVVGDCLQLGHLLMHMEWQKGRRPYHSS